MKFVLTQVQIHGVQAQLGVQLSKVVEQYPGTEIDPVFLVGLGLLYNPIFNWYNSFILLEQVIPTIVMIILSILFWSVCGNQKKFSGSQSSI